MRNSLAIAVLGVVLSGCVAQITDTLNVTYVSPGGVAIERLAILPVTAGEGLEGFRRTTGDSLFSALARLHPSAEIVSAEESLRQLNDAGLAARYADMVLAYDRTGILDRSTMNEMGKVLGARHLLNIRVAYVEQSRVGMGFVTSVAEYKTQAIELFAHVWDADRGDIVWEASGGAAATSGELTSARQLPEILASATQSLAGKIPISQ